MIYFWNLLHQKSSIEIIYDFFFIQVRLRCIDDGSTADLHSEYIYEIPIELESEPKKVGTGLLVVTMLGRLFVILPMSMVDDMLEDISYLSFLEILCLL